MKRNLLPVYLLLIMNYIFTVNMATAQDITLPAPVRTGGKPLMQALDERVSTRTFTGENLSLQQLSDLLWAGWGINRQTDNKRTAPSSNNKQEIEIYVALQEGLYLYDADLNKLKQIHNRDIRKLTGTQDFVGSAPVNLVFVADLAKRGKKEDDQITDSDLLSSWANTGFIAQNIYLYCASENLGCVIRAMIPRDLLAPEMELRSTQRIILAQSVGFPKK
ncbi:MAG: SagB/ThcOx family dehydrogenase [Bacteroidia bacterium]|nr:MAG: SagB/ThcOx family dehydrogenase [Bacteroidia bacterium]